MPRQAHDKSRVISWALSALLAGLLAAGAAHAAHPLATEDTGTQGAGNLEIENGLSRARAGGASAFAYQPQLSWGLTPSFGAIVQPSWLRGADGSRGLGDTNLDAKWRFYGEAPWSLGVRAGLALASNQHAMGLPKGDVSAHALLVATYDAAPFTVHANLGLARNPQGSGQRPWQPSASAALMWALDERLILTVDAGTSADPDPARKAWPATLLAGAIYTLKPGLDLDIGYQLSARAQPASKVWLLGLTYRFAP